MNDLALKSNEKYFNYFDRFKILTKMIPLGSKEFLNIQLKNQ